MKLFPVIDAEYLEDYKVKVAFSDGTSKVVDFEPFLFHRDHPQWVKYRQLRNFKKFKVERGNIVWGKDWDMIFPLEELHKGKIKLSRTHILA